MYWDEGTGSETFYALVSTNAFTLSYVKSTGLAIGDTYKWKVSAHNSVGESLLSSPALSVIAARAPDPPTSLTLISATSTHIEFSWSQLNDGGSDIINFIVYWD